MIQTFHNSLEDNIKTQCMHESFSVLYCNVMDPPDLRSLCTHSWIALSQQQKYKNLIILYLCKEKKLQQ